MGMYRLRHIVFATDFSSCAEQALDHARLLAWEHGATLHLVHVIDLPPRREEAPQAVHEQLERDAYRQITQIYEAFERGDAEVELVIERGEAPAPVLLDYAERTGADLIVLGTHGRRTLRRLMMGSVTEEVVRGATCPVFIVPEKKQPVPATPWRRILIPIDLSPTSYLVLPHAKELASAYDARLDLLHIAEGVAPANADELKVEMHRAVSEADGPHVEAESHVAAGYAAAGIVEFAAEHGVDVILLSSHGRTSLPRFLMGGVATKVLHLAPCPVYIVKALGSADA